MKGATRALPWLFSVVCLAAMTTGSEAQAADSPRTSPGSSSRAADRPGAPRATAGAVRPGPVARAALPGGDTLSLSDVVRRALSNSPEVAAARAGVSAEAAARWADWGSLLPQLQTAADFARIEGNRFTFEGEEGVARQSAESISFVRKGARQSASFHWEVLDGGRRFFRIKEGAAQKRAARRRLDRSERVVAARVKRTYFEALKQRKIVKTAERHLRAREEELERTRERHEAGSVGRLDLLGAKKELQEAEVRLLDARRRASEEIRRLQVEMGVRPGRKTAGAHLAPVELPRPDELDADELVSRALSTDPELKAVAAEAEAASAAAGASWTRYLPDVELSYGELRSEVGGPESDFFKFSPRDEFSQLALSVSWSPFRGFERRERRARARAAERRAKASRQARRLAVEGEVRSLVGEIRGRFERVQALEENLELARERMELARMRYEADRMEYDRFRTYIDDATDAADAFHGERAAYLKSWAELEELVGEIHFPSGS